MKNLLTILLFVITTVGYSQDRPPIVTNELQVQDLIWQGLEMERDSLSYWHPINSTSFTLRRPDNNFSQTYAFAPDSVFSPELNIWLCNYCTITYEGNSVLIRRDPSCSNCWQYSDDSGDTWIDLWCETSLDRTLAVAPSSVPVFKIGDFQDWPDEADLLAGVTYVGFKQDAENEGKVLRYENDTVVWGLEKVDSLFDQISEKWLKSGDTISSNRDSLTITVVNTDTIFSVVSHLDTIYSTIINTDTIYSQISRIDTIYSQILRVDSIYLLGENLTDGLDSIYFAPENEWKKNRDTVNTFWTLDQFLGVEAGIKYAKNVSIGSIDFNPYRLFVTQNSNTYSTALFSQGGSADIAQFWDGTNLKTKIANTGQITSGELTYPIADGDSAQVLTTDGDGVIGWSTINQSKWTSDTYGIDYQGGRVGIGQESESSSLLSVQSIDGVTAISSYSTNLPAIYAVSADNDGIVGIGSDVGRSGVYASSTNGYGIWASSSNGYAGYFSGGGSGVLIDDSLKVGTGTTISRSGSMAEKDFWSGTQAEYDALTPVSTTIYFIHNGYGWLGLFLLLLLSIGSKAQNWSAVKVGETDVVLIMQGGDTIWVKPSDDWTYEGVMTVGVSEFGDYGYLEGELGSVDPIGDFDAMTWSPPNEPILSLLNLSGIPETSNLTEIYIDGLIFTPEWDEGFGWIVSDILNPFPEEGEECSIKLKYTLIE